jgi:hypothetical protein
VPSDIVRPLWFIPVATTLAFAPGCFTTAGDDDTGNGEVGGSSGTSGMGGTSGASGSATGGTGGSTGVRCDESDPILCPSAEDMSLCINGTYQTLDCETACGEVGFEAGPCAEPGGCACGYPTDPGCEVGVNAFCACIEGTDTPCDAADAVTDPLSLYVTCHRGEPPENAAFFSCFGARVDTSGNIDCQAASDACR